MFMMIFVNDLAGGGEIVPNWMVHFSDRHHGGSGMTFVDLVFPSFLFLVGMSIPFALGSRLSKGEALWKILAHVAARTAALLAIGILMVNAEAGATSRWMYSMFLSSILAFCGISPRDASPTWANFWRILSLCLRVIGFAGMLYCAFTFVGPKGQRIITLSPFHIRTEWYGILGLIGWAYLAAAAVFLLFRTHRTALLGCVAVMLCFYPAERNGAFDNFWFANHIVSLSGTLGSHGAIAVAGILLASILVAPDTRSHLSRAKFTLLFIAGFASAALLLNGLYGISKNEATTSWCLWSCAITATLWLGFYYICDVAPMVVLAKPLAAAGANVLLAYLLSEMLPNPFQFLHFGSEPILGWIIGRSLLWAFVLLCCTAILNRIGFRLKL
jgi:predicted acyltransferase